MLQKIKWVCGFVICTLFCEHAIGQALPNLYPFPNGSGLLETYNANGKPIDLITNRQI